MSLCDTMKLSRNWERLLDALLDLCGFQPGDDWLMTRIYHSFTLHSYHFSSSFCGKDPITTKASKVHQEACKRNVCLTDFFCCCLKKLPVSLQANPSLNCALIAQGCSCKKTIICMKNEDERGKSVLIRVKADERREMYLFLWNSSHPILFWKNVEVRVFCASSSVMQAWMHTDVDRVDNVYFLPRMCAFYLIKSTSWLRMHCVRERDAEGRKKEDILSHHRQPTTHTNKNNVIEQSKNCA